MRGRSPRMLASDASIYRGHACGRGRLAHAARRRHRRHGGRRRPLLASTVRSHASSYLGWLFSSRQRGLDCRACELRGSATHVDAATRMGGGRPNARRAAAALYARARKLCLPASRPTFAPARAERVGCAGAVGCAAPGPGAGRSADRAAFVYAGVTDAHRRARLRRTARGGKVHPVVRGHLP